MNVIAAWLLSALIPYLDQRFTTLERMIMSVQDDVNAVTAEVKKGTGEVLAKIAELQAREPSVDLSELQAAAQALDDIVPDAPAPAEPPAEPPAA